MGEETQQHWAERVPRDAAQQLRRSHPDLEVIVEQLSGQPWEVLPQAARDAETLVLGSRGLSGFGGFLVGSVGHAVVARAELPVVLVRSPAGADGESAEDMATGYRPVVLGLDANAPDDMLIEFAFAEAFRRDTTLRAVHGWQLPAYYSYGLVYAGSPGSTLS
ncbi:universal stress protein [Streptomyces sp. NPDC058595]|uniref:universal stress protein n=1 Tax=Streptomyces sp. NPDC058595 TaxID=3346550 RepID=UPI0036556390